jgi:hypothetical protein
MRPLALAALAATACGGAPAALAQSQGVALSASISQLFEYETNPFLFDEDDEDAQGDLYASVTNLGFGLLSETTTQRLGLAGDFALRVQGGEAVENRDLDTFLVDPIGLRADYGQQWYNAEVTGGLRFRQRAIEFDRTISDILGDDGSTPDTGGDAVDDLRVETRTGNRQDYGADLGFAFATDAPSSYEFAFGAARTTFSDDTAGTDRTTFDGTGTWNLQVTDTLTTGLTAFYSDSSPDESFPQNDPLDNNERDISVQRAALTGNLFYQIGPNLGLGGRLGYSWRREEERVDEFGLEPVLDDNGDPVLDDDGNPVFAVVFDDYRTETTEESGILAGVIFAYETQRLNFSGDLGVTAAGATLQPVGTAELTYLLPQAEITGAIDQRFTFDEDGQEINRSTITLDVTRRIDPRSTANFGVSFDRQSEATDRDRDVIYRYGLTGSYTRELTPLSGATLGFGLARQDETDDEIDRLNLSAVYFRNLTQDVQANLGYQYRWRNDNDGTLDSQRVFVSVGRSFATGP